MTEVRRREDSYRAHGLKVKVLDAAALARAEPNLRGGLAGGLRVPDDAVVYPPRAARFLVESAVAAGAPLRTRLGVTVGSIGGDGSATLADGTRLSAGRGEARGPLCGMGLCFECRVSINGQPHCRSCLTLCEPGMEVRTDA